MISMTLIGYAWEAFAFAVVLYGAWDTYRWLRRRGRDEREDGGHA